MSQAVDTFTQATGWLVQGWLASAEAASCNDPLHCYTVYHPQQEIKAIACDELAFGESLTAPPY
ncbi:MAG: hypothetical protein PsegKO_11080 [Pseudohongiellaceae bacterium]